LAADNKGRASSKRQKEHPCPAAAHKREERIFAPKKDQTNAKRKSRICDSGKKKRCVP